MSEWPNGRSAVVLSRRITEWMQPRFPHRRAGAQQCRRSATTENQASGGARDWNGARRVEKKVAAAQFECSTWRTANGTGSCGACGSNDVALRWIVAQIAQ
jgi:hypothetical protein